MADSRIRDLSHEIWVTDEHTFAVDSPDYALTNAKNVTGEDVRRLAWRVITNIGVIANITNDANWDSNGDYIGVYTNLRVGDIYVDPVNRVKYEYNGVMLIRYHVNNVI